MNILQSIMSMFGSNMGKASMTMQPGSYGGWPSESEMQSPSSQNFSFMDAAGSAMGRGGGGGGGSSPAMQHAQHGMNQYQDMSQPNISPLFNMMNSLQSQQQQKQPMQMPMHPLIAQMLQRAGVM